MRKLVNGVATAVGGAELAAQAKRAAAWEANAAKRQADLAQLTDKSPAGKLVRMAQKAGMTVAELKAALKE